MKLQRLKLLPLCLQQQGRHHSAVCRPADASACAVMWSSHASVLGKYATFHLQDAGRCKAAARLPGSLREERLQQFAKLQSSDLKELLLWCSAPCKCRGGFQNES